MLRKSRLIAGLLSFNGDASYNSVLIHNVKRPSFVSDEDSEVASGPERGLQTSARLEGYSSSSTVNVLSLVRVIRVY